MASAALKRHTRPLKHLVQRALRLAGRELQYDFEARGFRLRRYRDLSKDPWKACRTILGREPSIILDVGANTGQTAFSLARAFPHAKIHCFEPTPDVAKSLRSNVAHLRQVRVHEYALGDADGSAAFHLNRMDQTNSLLPSAEKGRSFTHSPAMLETVETIDVRVETVASFCRRHGLCRVDILKTDCQGYDLRVIEGADGVNIPLIYAEACFVPFYEGQPSFGRFHDRMQELGYRLVCLYDTSFRTHYYQLSCNALFMREDMGRH